VSDPGDAEALRSLVARHYEFTHSARAQWVLLNWEQLLPKFVKVFPHEYKRVLGISGTSLGLSKLAGQAEACPTGVLHG